MDTANIIREIEKIKDALVWADRHFTAEAQMNAALHMAETVRPAPLASTIGIAIMSADQLLKDLKG